MKIVSWNVNGIRSALKKGLYDFVEAGDYDLIMLQEIKNDSVPLQLSNLGYHAYMSPSHKKGYSGTLSLTRRKPLSFGYGIGNNSFDSESRVITLEMGDFYVVNVYFPNSRRDLSRLDFKLKFDEAFKEFVDGLKAKKPVVVGGDFNVAHTELDIARPKDNEGNAGFTKEERGWFGSFLAAGYIDTYRMFVKDGGHYSWWTYRSDARERNIGWRIDYIVVSEEVRKAVKVADIFEDVSGSDHAPVYLELDERKIHSQNS